MEFHRASSHAPVQALFKRVLIIEDHREMREALADILTLEGYQVSAATDGQKGLREARRLRPDVILLDLMMPLMNGLQFRAEQVRDPGLASIPVIVMSAYDIEIAAAARLPKPFQMEDMLETVRRLTV